MFDYMVGGGYEFECYQCVIKIFDLYVVKVVILRINEILFWWNVVIFI